MIGRFRPASSFLGLLLLGYASLGRASSARNPVVLIEPERGATLRGGEHAVLEWESVLGAHLALATRAEEWEAFLSVDGGRTWAYRITPHLDLDLRRVVVPIPSVATSEARFLFRFGDEKHEVAVELPQCFTITAARDPIPGIIWPRLARGESALPGQPGVIAWVEGSRQGGELRPAEALVPVLFPDQASHTGAAPRELGTGVPTTSLPLSAPFASSSCPPAAQAHSAAVRSVRRAPPPDILLLIQRQNV